MCFALNDALSQPSLEFLKKTEKNTKKYRTNRLGGGKEEAIVLRRRTKGRRILGWFWDGFGMVLGWFWDDFGMNLG